MMVTICAYASSHVFLTLRLLKRNIYITCINCWPYCTAPAANTAIDKFISRLHKHKSLNQGPTLSEKKYDIISQHYKQNERKKQKHYRVICDEVCDKKLKELIVSNGLESAIATLICYSNVDRYPSKKTLVTLAAMSADERNLEAILKIQTVCKNAYPKEYIYQMEYNHYLAEALWKDGKYKKAIILFRRILLQYQKRTKKTSDMITFLTRHLIENRCIEELQLLLKTVTDCVDYGIHQPLANVWQQLFVSEVVGQQLMSNDIIKTSDPMMKKFILNKVNTIIKMSADYDDTDLLQRLIEVVLHFQHQPYYSKVFGALLNHQCDIGNVNGALATFHHMVEREIGVERTVCCKLMLLLGYHRKKAPDALLKMKYNIPTTQTIKYSF